MAIYRLSSYTIFTELADSGGKYMLVHGYTGAIDIVNDGLVRKLRALTSFTAESSPFQPAILEQLLKRGYITKLDEDEEVASVVRMADKLHNIRKKLVSSYVFMVAYDCNFRCPYCFENDISKRGREWSLAVFSREMVDKAYTLIEKIRPVPAAKDQTVTLYGGEPLMTKNREIIKYMIQEGKKRGFRFTAITNGYDLEAFADLLGAERIYKVQITIDGVKAFHDKRRIHYQHGKSFDKIMDNIRMALDSGVQVNIRMNTDTTNIDNVADIQRVFAERGFSDNKRFYFYVAPITLNKPTKSPCELDRKVFTEKMKALGMDTNSQDFDLGERLQTAIKNKQPISLTSIFCAAQAGYYTFDPYGDMYPCIEVVGKPEFVVGNYASGEIEWQSKARTQWLERNTGKDEICARCPYTFLCGGGCMARISRGEHTATFCEEYAGIFATEANKAYQLSLRVAE